MTEARQKMRFMSSKRLYSGWRRVSPWEGGNNWDISIETLDGTIWNFYHNSTGMLYDFGSLENCRQKARELYQGDPALDLPVLDAR